MIVSKTFSPRQDKSAHKPEAQAKDLLVLRLRFRLVCAILPCWGDIEETRFMTQPWCEAQRAALRAFRKAIVARSERENAIATEGQRRRQGTEQQYAAEKQRIEVGYAKAQAEALESMEETRRRLVERQEKERRDLKRDHQTQ